MQVTITGVGRVVANLELWGKKAKANAKRALTEVANEAEAYMKSNAPWQDQTGDARRGLSAKVSSDDESIEIALYHTVDYGVYLEKDGTGEYSILLPTMDAFKERFMSRLGRI